MTAAFTGAIGEGLFKSRRIGIGEQTTRMQCNMQQIWAAVQARGRTLGSAGGGLEADGLPAVGVRPGCHCMARPAERVGLRCTV